MRADVFWSPRRAETSRIISMWHAGRRAPSLFAHKHERSRPEHMVPEPRACKKSSGSLRSLLGRFGNDTAARCLGLLLFLALLGRHGLVEPCIDRKSTRLNSSHLGISYA